MSPPVALTSITCSAFKKCTVLPLFPWQLEVFVTQKVAGAQTDRWLGGCLFPWQAGTHRSRKLAIHSSKLYINSLSDVLKVDCRVYRMLWEQKTPGASVTESQRQEEVAFTLFSSVFPLSAFPPSAQKRIHVTKRNVYFGVRGNAPADRNFFVVVSFVFLAK